MNLVQTALRHGQKITESGSRWVTVFKNYNGEVLMDIGLVRIDGVREVPHATRKYYLNSEGEVTFLTYPHC